MFDYSLIHWTSFLSTVLLLSMSPGPDMAFLLGQTARHGREGGFAALFGVWTGAFVHVLMAALGLSAIVATSAVAFSVVKWAGAVYLIWLGLQAFFDQGSEQSEDTALPVGGLRPLAIYRQGVVVAILNPKVAIFFLAFLPQFIVPGAGATWAQLFLHGSLVIVVSSFIELPLVIGSARVMRIMASNQRIKQRVDHGLGALFIGLGIRLAIISH